MEHYGFPKTLREGVEGQISREELVFLGGMAKGELRCLGTGRLHLIIFPGSQKCPVGQS